MASIFVEARGCDGTLIFVLSRDRVIFWVRFSSVVQKRFRRLEGGEIMSIVLLTRDSCFNRTRTNLGAERLCKNGSSEGSGRKPRYICRVKQLLMIVFPSCEVD